MAIEDRYAPVPPERQGYKLIFAWAFVGLPLIWGVLRSVDNALKLFG